MKDADGRCTICGSMDCMYPASQSCFAAAIEDIVEEGPPA